MTGNNARKYPLSIYYYDGYFSNSVLVRYDTHDSQTVDSLMTTIDQWCAQLPELTLFINGCCVQMGLQDNQSIKALKESIGDDW